MCTLLIASCNGEPNLWLLKEVCSLGSGAVWEEKYAWISVIEKTLSNNIQEPRTTPLYAPMGIPKPSFHSHGGSKQPHNALCQQPPILQSIA
ncbi:MAG: hypothetical protein Q9170_005628 [Blastenia crenularia]